MLSLIGKCLLANPIMQDPFFARTVILITEHSAEEGTTGYIVNRHFKLPKKVKTPSQFRNLSKHIFMGGPVAPEKLTLLGIQCTEDKFSFCTIEQGCENIPPAYQDYMRIFIGHTAWSPGQLEDELAHRDWIIADPFPAFFNLKANETIWCDCICAITPYKYLIPKIPKNPSLN